MNERASRRWKTRTAVLGAGALFVIAWIIYLTYQYRQLEAVFLKPEEFSPTRVYSDVTRIHSPLDRGTVLSQLQALGYKFQALENDVDFTLRPLDYPDYLLPENHPTLKLQNQTVKLKFNGTSESSSLDAIVGPEGEIPELYLEPELVAALSRSGTDKKGEIRDLIPFENIPAPVWKAIISIEDQHFLEHSGLDPRGLARAIWINLKTRSLAQGGSTITQQLVKNLLERRSKNFFRKASEVFLSFMLEIRFEKERILERYLNEVYLGQSGNYEVHGVSEGAKLFFGKRLNELNLAEIAMMAGFIRGPGFYSPYRHLDRALSRQQLVLQKMVETGHISEDEAKTARAFNIRLAPPQTIANKAPHFVDFVKAELIRQLKGRMGESEISDAGLKVYTTLNVNMNRLAQKSVSEGITTLEKSTSTNGIRLEGALAAVDPRTGYMRALIGSRSYEHSTFNRILNMKRQVGSTFKPIVYLAALVKGYNPNGVAYGPATPVEDAPIKITYDRGRQSWSPRNYEKGYRGWIPLKEAFANSINTVAARIGTEVGIQEIVDLAHKLGIESELKPLPALTLGAIELSPVELLRVYATLANRGTRDELTVIRAITLENGTGFARFIYTPSQVLDPGPIDLETLLLQEVFATGTAASAAAQGFTRPAAGKTGTTNDYRDSWFAGFTPELTTVVWVGEDQVSTPASPLPSPSSPQSKKSPRLKLTGSTGALPIWTRFMKETLAGIPPSNFPESEFLKEYKIDKNSGQEAGPGCPTSQIMIEKYRIGAAPPKYGCELNPPPSQSEKTIQ